MYYPIVHGTLSGSIVFSPFSLRCARRWFALRLRKYNGFVPTKNIYREFSNHAIYVDEFHKRVLIAELISGDKHIINFNEFVECSIIQDGATLLSGGTGAAVMGGLIGGSTGATISASTKKSTPVSLSLSVRIVTSNIREPLYEIPIITSSVDRTSESYTGKMKFAQEIYATIIGIINSCKTSSYQRLRRSTWR